MIDTVCAVIEDEQIRDGRTEVEPRALWADDVLLHEVVAKALRCDADLKTHRQLLQQCASVDGQARAGDPPGLVGAEPQNRIGDVG